MSNITVKDGADILSLAKKILLVTHAHPDGDTLGSAFGLKHAMEACGHEVNVICADEIPERLRFITENHSVLSTPEGFSADIVCAIDAAETALMGEYGKLDIKLKLDHHPSGTPYAEYNYIDGTRAACAEIIFDVIKELEPSGHAKLTPSSATALYAAITSDTGCFRYSNVTSNTLRISAELMDAGADCENVCKRLFETVTKTEAAAQKVMLNNLNYYLNETVAVITVSNKMKEENGFSDDDLGTLGNYIRQIEGVILAIVIKQSSKSPQIYKISMRSGPDVNCSDMCAMFGGGGHARAAGASIEAASPKEAEEKILSAVCSALNL